jgi:hypothetical protein
METDIGIPVNLQTNPLFDWTGNLLHLSTVPPDRIVSVSLAIGIVVIHLIHFSAEILFVIFRTLTMAVYEYAILFHFSPNSQ